ncbi:MAG: flagellar export protein FliJ [Deltaproteobacteria bacterium]|nr:flagellar export protein FliJ [Deltaproteobacteria bacterium]
MNRFVFSLEPLYDYRMRLEDICKKEFGEALRRLEDEETKLELIKESYRKSSDVIDGMKEKGAPMEEFSLYYAYITRLKEHIEEQEKVIVDVRALFEAKRVSLAESAKKKKVVELLKEKSYGLYSMREDKAEQKASDDLTSSRFRSKERA